PLKGRTAGPFHNNWRPPRTLRLQASGVSVQEPCKPRNVPQAGDLEFKYVVVCKDIHTIGWIAQTAQRVEIFLVSSPDQYRCTRVHWLKSEPLYYLLPHVASAERLSVILQLLNGMVNLCREL